MNDTHLPRERLHASNSRAASALRRRFHEAGVYVVSLTSCPGAGKTALLQRLLSQLRGRYRVAAMVGGLSTRLDGLSLARTGVPVRRIKTGPGGHLEADHVREAITGWPLEQFDFLFIENAAWPAASDLGEDLRVVLFAVTEGENKPLKYPALFRGADAVVLSKIDLASAVRFDAAAACQNIETVWPGTQIFKVSARTGAGVAEWASFLDQGFICDESSILVGR